MSELEPNQASEGDLSITAQYTSQAWIWGGFDYAELFASEGSARVFGATNSVMAFMGWFRKAPSLRHSLVQRHAMIDHLVRRSGCTQIIELAAGLSRRGATFSEDETVRYVEVDLPGMTRTKAGLLAQTERGREVAARPNLRRVAGDVRSLDLAELVEPGPVCVIAEGLLMYFDAEEQQLLWRKISGLLRDRPGSVLVFDFVPAIEQPKPGLLGWLLGVLMRLFTKGRGFVVDERTRDQVVDELVGSGFSAVRYLEPGDLSDEAEIPALDELTQTLVWEAQT